MDDHTQQIWLSKYVVITVLSKLTIIGTMAVLLSYPSSSSACFDNIKTSTAQLPKFVTSIF